MSIIESTYFGLTRIREQSPDAKDWAAVDHNPEIISLILKAFENHSHTATAGIKYPGYNSITLTNLITNPELDTNATGWERFAPSGNYASVGRAADSLSPSGWAYEVTSSTSNGDMQVYTEGMLVSVTPGDSIIIRISGRKVTSTSATTYQNMLIRRYNNSSVFIDQNTYTNQVVNVSDNWVEHNLIWTVPTGTSKIAVGLQWTGFNTSGNNTVRATKAQIVKNAPIDPGYFKTTYNNVDSGNPTLPTLSEQTTGGILSPGTTVGVRLSYIDTRGLETDASSEQVITLAPSAARPLTPQLVSKQIATGALSGGTYVYAITKRKGSGETLMSDVLPVEIPYDNTYSVTLSFNSISSYSDGTDAINIYRSTGLASSFQLVTTITTSGTTQFTDTNVIPPQNVNVQPPTNSTFDAARKVRISWAAITHPANARYLRVYITQQAGLWSEDHLLNEIDLTTGASNYIDYLGSESLRSGWPLNTTQVISTPPKINLGTETTGAPNLTADMDFNGFKAYEMVLGNTSLNTNGSIWYDSVNNLFKGYANGAQVTLSPLQVLKNWLPNPSGETNGTYWTPSMTSVAGGYDSPKSLRRSPSSIGAGATETVRSAIATTEYMPIQPGQFAFARAAVRESYTLAAGSSLTLAVYFYDSGGTQVGAPVTVNTQTSPTANTWYALKGSTTAPAGVTYAALAVNLINNGGSLGSGNIDVDAALLGKVSALGQEITYFDGDTPGGQWVGTPHASASISGAFQHGVEEAGGHRADNITFGTSNVAAVLSRIANNTDGSRKVAQGTVVATTLSANQSITSTTYVDVNDMTAVLTPDFVGQWIEVKFHGNFQLSIPTGQTSSTMTVALSENGTPVPYTESTQTAVVNNQNLMFSFHYSIQAWSTSPITYKIRALSSVDATITALQYRRMLTARKMM